jgi:hypothetical protein
VATHAQAKGKARATPQTAPPRMERYIEPGREKAWRLEDIRINENGTERKHPQEVGDDIRDNDTERIYVAVFLEEVVEILEVGKRLRYVKQRTILPDR